MNEVSISSTFKCIKAAGDVLNFVATSYNNRQTRRVKKFFECIDMRYESAKPEEIEWIQQYIESEEGQDVLASFADSITQTSCDRVHMALAMLLCKDLDHPMSQSEQYTFVSAVVGMTNDLLDFFLEIAKLDREKGNFPYPRSSLSNNDCKAFKDKGWDDEAIFVYVNDLIRLRLILPDPSTAYTVPGNSNGWTLWFGITDRTIKMAGLINKASEYLKISLKNQ
ncbi:hypothetical protein QNE49_000386 [Vibrio fluvialis]|nr:hypothetical protein [Vibrio fluvialis]